MPASLHSPSCVLFSCWVIPDEAFVHLKTVLLACHDHLPTGNATPSTHVECVLLQEIFWIMVPPGSQPLPENSIKKLVKRKVIDYWEIQLRDEAAPLNSFRFFKPDFISPHPMFLSAGSSHYEVTKQNWGADFTKFWSLQNRSSV